MPDSLPEQPTEKTPAVAADDADFLNDQPVDETQTLRLPALSEDAEQPTLTLPATLPAASVPVEQALTAMSGTSARGLQRLRSASIVGSSQQFGKALVIAGSGHPEARRLSRAPRRSRPRPLRMQAIVGGLAAVMVLVVALAVGVARDPQLAGPLRFFSAYAGTNPIHHVGDYFTYRVHSGDTIDSIAKHFHVTIGGIYEMNSLYAGAEVTVGQVLKIPYNLTYGANYKPSPPPPTTGGGGGSYPTPPPGTVYGPCMFCSVGGYTDGTGGLCAPQSSTNLGFDLIQPDPGAHWVRGFTWYHNGVDLSTGVYGTPLVAAQNGQVIFAGWDAYGGGFSVRLNHCWWVGTSYGHMQQIFVHVGQYVHKGDIIGLQGSTGNSTGPHVHFMVWWHNQYVNPLEFYRHLGFPYP